MENGAALATAAPKASSRRPRGARAFRSASLAPSLVGLAGQGPRPCLCLVGARGSRARACTSSGRGCRARDCARCRRAGHFLAPPHRGLPCAACARPALHQVGLPPLAAAAGSSSPIWWERRRSRENRRREEELVVCGRAEDKDKR